MSTVSQITVTDTSGISVITAGVQGVAGPNTLKALDAAVAGKLGIASPKGPAGDIDRLARPGSEIDKIFKQVVTDYSLVPQNERDPEYKRVRRQVMNNIRTELGSDKREERGNNNYVL